VRPRGRWGASARTDFYCVRRINADACGRPRTSIRKGCPDGNFHSKTSFMTSLVRDDATIIDVEDNEWKGEIHA
jgi:hypothetical protein